jgi:hypothetical protein
MRLAEVLPQELLWRVALISVGGAAVAQGAHPAKSEEGHPRTFRYHFFFLVAALNETPNRCVYRKPYLS